MNMPTIIRGAAALAAAAILYASPALATEGYFSHGYGAVNKSMAGAGVATGFDAMSQATNPAALANDNPNFTVDMSVFSPHRSYTVTGNPSGGDCGGGPGSCFGLFPGSYDSGRNLFFIPAMAATYSINDSSSYGWAFYGNGGMNTTWPAVNISADPPCGGGPFCGGKTGVDYAQAFLQLTYARKFDSGFSIGVSPIFVAQRFKAFGLVAFSGFSANPAALTDNGYDWSYGYGLKIGGQMDIGAGFRFGAAYQTQMYMQPFDKYAGLFAEQGNMDVPSAYQAGFSWDSGSGITVALDYKRINYEDVKAISNPFLPNLMTAQLGDNNGAGFGWENINIYKLGFQIEATPTIKLRAGYAMNDQPIPSTEVMFNILAPGVMEQHYTAGLTWQVTPNSAVNFGFMYAPSTSVTGPNMLEIPDQQMITIEMWQWESTIGWTWTF